MPRGLTLVQIAALSARRKSVAYFVHLDLPVTSVRAWNGVGEKSALGETWSGVGEFGIIDGVESSRSLTAQSISIGLHGLPGDLIDDSVIAATRSERYQGRPLTIYLGFLDFETGALLDDPTAVWVGVADALSFRIGAEISVSLTGEHFSSHLRRANRLRMTTESHAQRLGQAAADDLFFEAQSRLMGQAKPLLE